MKIRQFLLHLSLAAFVSALLLSCTSTSSMMGARSSIIKSPNDDREYRHLVLDNGLRVVLVSDPETDKSAASLSVFRGSFDDPVERPGLAHFLEHMLFIGTEKYPEVDGYFTFIQSHGGSANAYTASEHTNYFFDIHPEFFREGLDRFAQFFISPLFDKEYVEREKNAVDSEYQLQIKDDGWRGYVVRKVLFNPDHPASSFNIGSLDTLAGDVHSALLDFYATQYSANQMGLVVISNESLEEMQPWVTEMFAPIKNRNLEPVWHNAPLFDYGTLPATLEYQMLKENHELSFAFPIPSLLLHYRSKPTAYITNLLGHEGDGSLHKALTEKGWITGLVASSDNVDKQSSLIYVTLSLTPEGAASVPQITTWVFDYLDNVREGEIDKWRYKEQATLAELGFRFREKSQAINVARNLSPALQHYPTKDLLVAPWLMEDFNPDLIEDFLSYLTRDNAVMIVAGPDIEGNKTEKWFSVKHRILRGPFLEAPERTSALALPAPNPFLPKKLKLLRAKEADPQLAASKDGLAIYLDKDLEFGVPRAVMNINVQTHGGLVSLEDRVSASLYARLVQDKLNALAYPALMAGLGYGISASPSGFVLSVSGYADKQLVLLNEVLQAFANLDIDPARFRVFKDEYARDLQNAHKERPFQQVYARVRNSIVSASWEPEQQETALASLNPARLVTWRNRVLHRNSIQALVVGNADKARVKRLQALLDKWLNIGEIDVVNAENEQVTGITEVDIKVDHEDAALMLYVQNDKAGTQARAVSGLLTHLIRPGYFASLRTEQQLGYAVFATPVVFRNLGGVGFVIQSPVAAPQDLKSRTEAFLATQVKRFAEMPDAEFQENKQGLIANLIQKDTSLGERSQRYWSDLDLGNLDFDTNQQIADAVARLSKADMQAALNLLIEKLQGKYVMIYSEGRFSS